MLVDRSALCEDASQISYSLRKSFVLTGLEPEQRLVVARGISPRIKNMDQRPMGRALTQEIENHFVVGRQTIADEQPAVSLRERRRGKLPQRAEMLGELLLRHWRDYGSVTSYCRPAIMIADSSPISQGP